MPTLIILDLVFLVISFVICSSFNLIVFAVAPRRALNRSFVLFNTSIILWVINAILLRLSLWLGSHFPAGSVLANAQIWIDISGVTLGLISVLSLVFTVTFLERNNTASKTAIVVGFILEIVILYFSLHHKVATDPRVTPSGTFERDLGPMGWIGAAAASVYYGWSLRLFWQERHRKGEPYLPLGILVIWAGFVVSIAFHQTVLTMPITNMLGMTIMGYSILNRQIFNPLKDHNISLQKEILARIDTESTLKSSLKEKELLLREVHHRVKNNLQVISSLLNLQVSHIRDPASQEAFKESQNRIRSMSLVHELLYKTKNFQRTNFDIYLHSLLTDLFSSYGVSPERIRCEIRAGEVPIPIGIAIPCGLVINELISNALKYAFPAAFKGKPSLTIVLRAPESGKVELLVQDNGVGLPADFDVKRSKSLGMQLVSMLVEDQLKGSLEITGRRGTRIRILFAV